MILNGGWRQMMRTVRVFAGVGLVCVLTLAHVVVAHGPSAFADPIAANTNTPIGVTPMMGFNNWARFACTAQSRLDGTRDGYSFQQFMMDQAKAMEDTGLVATGYTNLTVDDCWMQRNNQGYLQGAPKWGASTQPGFDPDLKNYMDYVHARGMGAGLYSTAGTTTCQGVPAGIRGHEQDDSAAFVYWGADSLKLDNCGINVPDREGEFTAVATALGRATANTVRKILFNQSAPAGSHPNTPEKLHTMEYVRKLGQMWRVSPDIAVWSAPPTNAWDYPHADDYYEGGVYQNYTDTIALARYNAPGNINDADMLLIGDNGQLTLAEQRSQFSLWAVMGAPLVISTDVRRLAADPARYAAELQILKNREVIAVNQDPLGAGGYLASRSDPSATAGVDVVVKPLADGRRAVAVLNKNPTRIDYTLDLASVGFLDTACAHTVRDLWTHSAQDVTSSVTTSIAAHDTWVAAIAPGDCAPPLPVGQIQTTQTHFQTTALCLEASGGAAPGAVAALAECNGSPRQRWQHHPNGLLAAHDRPSLCLSAGSAGAGLVTCNPADPKHTWTYHRSGNLTQANGQCLDVNGGNTGNPTARISAYPCGAYQPNQSWSAPSSSPPPP